jgi:hypothetical protein
LGDLVERGLSRDAVELRIMDGLPGLETIFRATLFLPSETACEAPHGVPDFSRLEHLPDEMGEQSEQQEHECADPEQEVSGQLWGFDFFLVHST